MTCFLILIVGIWRVISEATWKKEGYIHRLSTKDIEKIYKKDIINERATPRSYICTKDIEAFEVHLRPNGRFCFIFLFCKNKNINSLRSNCCKWTTS